MAFQRTESQRRNLSFSAIARPRGQAIAPALTTRDRTPGTLTHS